MEDDIKPTEPTQKDVEFVQELTQLTMSCLPKGSEFFTIALVPGDPEKLRVQICTTLAKNQHMYLLETILNQMKLQAFMHIIDVPEKQ